MERETWVRLPAAIFVMVVAQWPERLRTFERLDHGAAIGTVNEMLLAVHRCELARQKCCEKSTRS